MNDDFMSWIFSRAKNLYIATLAFVYMIVSSQKAVHGLGNYLGYWPLKLAPLAPYALQWIAMLLLLVPCSLVRPKPPITREDETTDEHRRMKLAIDASMEFWRYWVWLVATWLFFYLALFLRAVLTPSGKDPLWLWGPGIDALNNLQGILLFVCYWQLTTITVGDNDQKRPAPVALLSVAFVLFFIADLLVSSRTGDPTQFRPTIQLLSGLWVGVCLGLLVGCFESEYFHVVKGIYLPSRRVVISLLYLYAVLQLAYVGFMTPAQISGQRLPFVENVATILSLPLKLLFIGLCYWMLKERRLEFYMWKTRRTIEETETDWQDFHQQPI